MLEYNKFLIFHSQCLDKTTVTSDYYVLATEMIQDGLLSFCIALLYEMLYFTVSELLK